MCVLLGVGSAEKGKSCKKVKKMVVYPTCLYFQFSDHHYNYESSASWHGSLVSDCS